MKYEKCDRCDRAIFKHQEKVRIHNAHSMIYKYEFIHKVCPEKIDIKK